MARISTPLTDATIKKSKPKEKDYKISDGLGLYLLVKTNGTKMWRFDFSYGKQRKSMSFGVYPLVSLKDARAERLNAKKLLCENKNPIVYKNKKSLSEEITLNYVVDEWILLLSQFNSKKTIDTKKRILKNVLVKLGNFPIKDITRIDIIHIIDTIQSKDLLPTARRLFQLIIKVYMFAVTKEYVPHNIIADIDKTTILIPEKDVNYPAITDPVEITQLLYDIWVSLPKNFKTDISTIFIFKLIPYVFVRSDNIRLMKWDEIDFEKMIWIIPKEKMKMKVDFIIPLPTQAIRILKEIEPYSRHLSKFVFPSMYKNDRSVCGGTLSATLIKLGYKGRHTFHGFRSMFSTNANILKKEHGEDSSIIECCLAHKEKNKVKSIYDREEKYKYLENKRIVVQWYADWLDNLFLIK